MEENARFISVIDTLRATKRLTDYVQAALVLGTNKAGISDIKSGRKKLSLDLLRRMKESYPDVNLDYIVIGEGDLFISSNSDISPEITNQHFLNMMREKDEIIRQQAEQIGMLKAELSHRGQNVENAQSIKPAAAG